ncbi:MAG: hypothetical protein ACOCUV_02840 [bacterium]
MLRYFISIVLFISILHSYGQEPEPLLKPYGSVRTGYFTKKNDGRDGNISSKHEGRLRLQLGLKLRVFDNLSLNTRFAGRFSTAQEEFSFVLTDHIPPGKDGLKMGSSTIDEFHLDYKPFDALRIRLGRMQTKFELGGVPKKSLDRNDSPNTEINWTDGIHFTYTTKFGMAAHFIAQYNSKSGGSNIFRLPLSFEDPASRVSYYGVLQDVKEGGFFAQRELSATYIPQSIPDINENNSPKDLFAVATRLAVAPKLGAFATLFIGGELGYANRSANKALLNTGFVDEGQGGQMAYQVSINLLDMFEKHNIGFIFGNIDDGWLISPDLRSNNYEREIRHQWKITKKLSMENRIRWRSDKEQIVGAQQKRQDVDLYFRFTYKL